MKTASDLLKEIAESEDRSWELQDKVFDLMEKIEKEGIKQERLINEYYGLYKIEKGRKK